MNQITAPVLIAMVGLTLAWAVTVPLHRFKELRPLTPRDVAAEVGGPDSPPLLIRASYRQARCTGCRKVCDWRDVAPVLSWARGCAACGTRPPFTVPLVQLSVPLAMVLTIVALDDPWEAVPYLWLVLALTGIAVIDLRIWLIPYWMPWAGAAVGLGLIAAASVATGEPGRILHALGGGVACFAFFFILWFAAPAKLGFSDVRLALLIGLYLAWLHPLLVIYGLLFGSVIALVVGGAALLLGNEGRFALGPPLALGTMAAIWLHEPILSSVTLSG